MALVFLSQFHCSPAEIIYRAQKAGAIGVMAAPSEQGAPLFTLSCTNDTQCSWPISMPTVSFSHADFETFLRLWFRGKM